ncbi:MAG: integrin alpha, partial [Candidatus Krumholzibacteriia bacterium]
MSNTTLRPRPRLFAAQLALVLLAGSALAATVEPIITPVGLTANAQLGLFVSAAGDLNADGRPDFVIGAPGARITSVATGQAWVYFGRDTLSDTPDLVLQGEASGDQFGTSVRGCGDVNGDGWDDLVVGAPRNDAAFYNAGRAYVYFGGPSL